METDGDRLIRDVIYNVSRPIAFDAVMRVRTSTGVRATDFFGHFYMANTTDMELASVDCDKANIFAFAKGKSLKKKKINSIILSFYRPLQLK